MLKKPQFHQDQFIIRASVPMFCKKPDDLDPHNIKKKLTNTVPGSVRMKNKLKLAFSTTLAVETSLVFTVVCLLDS